MKGFYNDIIVTSLHLVVHEIYFLEDELATLTTVCLGYMNTNSMFQLCAL